MTKVILKNIKYYSIITILLLILFIVPSMNIFPHDKMEYIVEAVEIDPEEAPKIDGELSDTVWKKGKVITNFVQRDPIPGAPATEKSEVYILYDKENLYVGFFYMILIRKI